MTGWAFVKLGDLTTVVTKGTTPTSIGYEFKDAGINFVKVESISNNGTFIPDKFAKIDDECNAQLKRSQLEENDILFSIAGAIGRTAIVPKSILPANTNQALAIIRLKPDAPIYPDYLLRALASQSIIEQTDLMKGGVAQQNLSLAQLKAFEIPLPPLPVQKAIVAKLDAAFASIEQAIAAAERNAENAKQLFQSYLSEVFERGGDGWHKSALGDECKFIDYRGKTPIKTETGMRLITAKNVKKGYINLTPQEFVSPNSYDEWMTRGLPQSGDVLFTTEAPLGHVAQLDTSDKVVVGQRLITLQIKSGNITSTFLKYMLLSSPWQKMLSEKSTGATVQGIKASLLKLIPVLFPSLEEQDLIITRLVEIENMTSQLAEIGIKKKAHLTALKQSLLNQAFNGHLVDA